ncbi:MAG: sulfite exporter TauE/SafE family protein [Candidatus Dormibacteria bacterium]
MHPETALFLAVAGFLGGLVDSVVGGGGVITLPALLLAGVPVQLSLGTNKLAGTLSSLTATTVFARAGRVDTSLLRLRIVPVLAAAALGALAATRLDPHALRLLILVAVLAAAAWAALRPVDDATPLNRPSPKRSALAGVLVVGIGFYDGILGPGTGLFLFAVLVALDRLAFVDAAGTGRAFNLASNIAALLVFAGLGRVNPVMGLTMGAGVVIGARTGASMAIRRGAAFVRPMLLLAGGLVALRLAFQLSRG